MYCIKCGVALEKTEKQCPLCGTVVFHPDLPVPQTDPLYPANRMPAVKPRPWGALMIATMLFLLPISICIVCDVQVNGMLNWSGYVSGALALVYLWAILPSWFSNPNPIIFVPVSFAGAGLYLLYICLATGGSWYLPFGLPVTAILCAIVTAVVVLTRVLRKGHLYVFGGASLAMGGFMLLLEHLLHVAFGIPGFGTWSLYPLIVFSLLGLGLILVALCPPLRESLGKKFFL